MKKLVSLIVPFIQLSLLTHGVVVNAEDTEQMIVPEHSEPLVIEESDPHPASRQNVTIKVEVPGAKTIDLKVKGYGCGALTQKKIAGHILRETGKVAVAGNCILEADVLRDGKLTTYASTFSVNPVDLPPQIEIPKNYRFCFVRSDCELQKEPDCNQPVAISKTHLTEWMHWNANKTKHPQAEACKKASHSVLAICSESLCVVVPKAN